jgi:starch phosphorylase
MIGPFIARSRIAYFSMEVALQPAMHTYAGGLGVLAGDTARACADLELPVVFVTLVSRAGYFRQSIDAQGRQVEADDPWSPADACTALDAMVAVPIEGRPVWVRPWLYVHAGAQGQRVPVLLLDTDLAQNAPADREITHHLYGGDEAYRLRQEIVLGIGGVRLLRALGFDVQVYHLNEGHAALLALELLRRTGPTQPGRLPGPPAYDVAAVRARCAFTTHTPIDAAQDPVRPRPVRAPAARLRRCRGAARPRRRRPAQHDAPGVQLVGLGQRRVAAPRPDDQPALLPDEAVWRCHEAAKADLVRRVQALAGAALDPQRPIIGFARRMTAYKRPLLLFREPARLAAIAARHPFQVVLAGKAHPRDEGGKEAIRQLHTLLRELPSSLRAVFLPDHDMALAKTLVGGADVWLNTPLPPLEASGTSGMKAALNGVLNLSVLDGWWLEACEEGVNGWAIGDDDAAGAGDAQHAAALYDKLERVVLPLYERDLSGWRRMMKEAIRSIPSHFNSHRMMRRYGSEVYLR